MGFWGVLAVLGVAAFAVAVLAAGPVARRGDGPFLLLQAGVVGAIAFVPILRRQAGGDGGTAVAVAGAALVFALWCAGVIVGFRVARRAGSSR